MDNLTALILFVLNFILIVGFFIYFKKKQDLIIENYFNSQREKAEISLELLTTFDLIKELKKRQNPPVFIGWINKDENDKINYFIFKKNLEKKTSLIILQRMVEDIKKYS